MLRSRRELEELRAEAERRAIRRSAGEQKRPRDGSGRDKNEGEGKVANYYFEVRTISREKGRSFTKLANYITGHKLHDHYLEKTYYKTRVDVIYQQILQPEQAPAEFQNLQMLCDAGEGQSGARTPVRPGSLSDPCPMNYPTRIRWRLFAHLWRTTLRNLTCAPLPPSTRGEMRKRQKRTIPMSTST